MEVKNKVKNRVHSDCVAIMQGIKTEAEYDNIAFGIVEEVLVNLGYNQNTIDTNGWQVDYWSTYNKPGSPNLKVCGSMYYGDCVISLK